MLVLASWLCGGCLAAPAEARLGDTVPAAREFARLHAVKYLHLYTDHRYPEHPGARVIMVVWGAPGPGWPLGEAARRLKLIVGGRRRLAQKTTRSELGWIYNFIYAGGVTAVCRLERGRIGEVQAALPAYDERDVVEEKFLTFLLTGD